MVFERYQLKIGQSIFNNAIVLGLINAVRKFPRGLLTGTCPLSWTLAHRPQVSTRHPKLSESIDKLHHEIPIGQSIIHVQRPSLGPMITFDRREQFTDQDIEDMNRQLESNLLSRNNDTRLSRSQTQTTKQSSRLSHASDRSHFSHISDKPWKP
jgi:hypothetical protein